MLTREELGELVSIVDAINGLKLETLKPDYIHLVDANGDIAATLGYDGSEMVVQEVPMLP